MSDAVPQVEQRTLMIADDHPIFRHGLRDVVERLPWVRVVAEAESGDAALVQLDYHRPDMIILDIAMPGRDGLGVLEELATRDPMPVVIIVTSYDEQAYLERSLQLGARAYLLKDSASDDILGCLETVRRGDVYISPSLGGNRVRLPRESSAGAADLGRLTPMERTVLGRVAEFKTSKEIAAELGVSFRTVQNHRANICDKLGLHGTHQLMAFAREHSDLLC
jgi:DNA-binding NarL/FixJ family response regulator